MTAAARSSAGKPSSRHQACTREAVALAAGSVVSVPGTTPGNRCSTGLDGGADRVEVLDEAQVEGDRRGAGGPEEVHAASAGRSSAARPAPGTAPTRSASSCSTTLASTADSLPKPLTVGRPPCRTAGSDGSSSWTTTLGARHAGSDGGRRAAVSPSARDWARSRRAPASTTARSPRVRSSPAASVHGPGDLHLERAGPARRRRRTARRGRAPGTPAPGAGRCPAAEPAASPAGREVEGQVDEERRAAADQVGARPAGGQLGQVRRSRAARRRPAASPRPGRCRGAIRRLRPAPT